MDEHIIVDGGVEPLLGELLDDNLNPLGWWIDKHNRYADREALEVLIAEAHGRVAPASNMGRQTVVKRWLKEQIYSRMPGGLRAFAYFVYRYVVRLGFLDGKEGTAFHLLQGFWYRYLVDVKLHEVRLYMRRNDVDEVTAICDILGIDLTSLAQSKDQRDKKDTRNC